MNRFISVLAWKLSNGIKILGYGSGGKIGSATHNGIFPTRTCEQFDFESIEPINDDKAKLSLALIREARNLRNPFYSSTTNFYSFLIFWKVLETAVGDGKIRDWITNQIQTNNSKLNLKAFDDLTAEQISVHLHERGRHAIAHAYKKPFVDPDLSEDADRIINEIDIIEKLATLAISEKFRI